MPSGLADELSRSYVSAFFPTLVVLLWKVIIVASGNPLIDEPDRPPVPVNLLKHNRRARVAYGDARVSLGPLDFL